MQNSKDYQFEIIKQLEPMARVNLKYLSQEGDKKWNASQFFGFMQAEDYPDQLRDIRAESKLLSDEDLVALVGNTITEEALPNYARLVANYFPDFTGVSQLSWNVWERAWEAEEKEHGRVLDRYLFLTGRVNTKAVDSSTDSLIRGGMDSQPNLFRGLAYPAFQEPATARSHLNMGKIAKQRGVKTLYDICVKIAGDESRHAKFYESMISEVMRLAPNDMVIAWRDLMRDGVTMPAKNMADSNYVHEGELFRHFSRVTSDLGIYTTKDYSDILRRLNKSFGVEHLSLSGQAAKAQEELMKLPSTLERLADRKKLGVASKVKFDWIYGREV